MDTILKYISSNLSDPEAIRIYRDLQHLFDAEKAYLEKDISLKSVADKLQTNTKYLSQVVNTRTSNNFQVFVNRYRIQEFQQRLLSGDARLLTFYGLARDCGFNNRSTFYRSFKDFTGRTPKGFYSLHLASAA